MHLETSPKFSDCTIWSETKSGFT